MKKKSIAFLFLLHMLWQIGAKECPECGNSAVPYPLRTDPSCGEAGYSISCQDGQLRFNSTVNGFSYPIRQIDSAKRKLVISSSLLQSGTCATGDSAAGGLQLDQTQAFNVTSSNTVMLLNCTSIILRSPLNCSQSSICHKLSAGSCAGNGSLCCSFRAGGSSTSYRIRTSACSAYVSVVDMDPSLDPRQWDYGVELEWGAPKEPLCAGASQSCAIQNSHCKPDKTNKYRCMCDPGFRWDSYTGLCSPVQCTGCEARRRRLVAGLASALPVMAVVLVATLFLLLRRRRIRVERQARAQELTLIMSNAGGRSSKVFTPGEMRRATKGFSKDRLLGSGGFGEVYKGILDNGVVVAIKAAKLGNTKGRDQVVNEVRILSQVNHRNLVRIWGCCVDMEEPLVVVYEYIPNGTLYEWLRGRRSFLDWRTRLGIALQTAEGLAYLHSAAVPPIYHRDVKPSNILLDDLMEARVCDFGLSRLVEPDITHVSTCAQGTLGYLDPEYYRKYQLTDKSDVYSFGMVLLEIVTSQKAVDFSRDQDEVNLAMYVMARVEKGEAMDVVDKELLKNGRAIVTGETMVAVVMLAINCLRESRMERPTMKEVVEELSYILDTYDAAGEYHQQVQSR